MQFSALLRHLTFTSSNILRKATPRSKTEATPPIEVQTSSVGKRYMKMGDKTCWEATGVEREKFKILSKEIQDHQRLWGSPSEGGSISTWGLYMIGLTPEEAVPTLLFCCHDKSSKKEMRRLIESSGILAKEEYRHIRVGDCSKPPEFCVADDKLRVLSAREVEEHWDPANEQDDLIHVETQWDTLPGRMKVTFKDTSGEPVSQYSTIGMTFQHQGKMVAVTAGHTLSHDLRSTSAEEDVSEFEFDLEDDCSADSSDSHSHHISPAQRQNINDTLNPNWRSKDKILICDPNQDFAVIQDHRGISVTSLSSYPPSLLELLQNVSREPEDIEVTAMTGSLGRIKGKLSGTPSFIRLPHATHFQEVWTVQFSSPLAPGDSGSLISDMNSGQIFGHIVAGAPDSGVAYIMPAFKVLERIVLSLEPRKTARPASMKDARTKESERYHSKMKSFSVVHSHLLDACDQSPLNQRIVLIAAAGFFVDSYSLSVIRGVLPIMAIALGIQCMGRFGVLLNLAVFITLPVGALVSGVVADLYGRRTIYGLGLVMLITGIFGLALTKTEIDPLTNLSLAFSWGMIIGWGIGGGYTLSAVITAEFSEKRHRATMLSVVFLAQSLGKLAAFGLTIAVISPLLSAFSSPATASTSETHIQGALDKAWRFVIASGSIPAFVALCFRLTIPETPRYLSEVLGQPSDLKDVNHMPYANPWTPPSRKFLRPSRNVTKFLRSFFKFVCQPTTWRILVGTSISWFFLDVAFYGLGLNAPAFAIRTFSSASTIPDQTIYQTLVAWRRQLFLELPFGEIVGSVITIFALQRVRGQRIQMVGFAALGTIFLLAGAFYFRRDTATVGDGAALHAMNFATQLAFNLGPNTMTFIIPAELFPTRYRATCYGIAAASGKMGAILAQFLFWNVSATQALPFAERGYILFFFAVLSFLGVLVTRVWIPESDERREAGTKRALS